MGKYRFVGLLIGCLLLAGCYAKHTPPLDQPGDHAEAVDLNPVVIEEELELDQHAKTFDIPIVVNQRVEAFIKYFQGPGRAVFGRYLQRSRRYIPMMRNVLREHGLPEDLVYLAMIESGFNPRAYSRAHASGPWQFIYRTGKRYNLQVNDWVDERNDPEKSTVAAARHLKDLYDELQDWYLAAASYNAGIGKIRRAIKHYRTEDFWELVKKGRILKPETKNYVPKMIAAAMIAKDPDRYGFSGIEYDKPFDVAKISLAKPTDLRLLAERANCDYEELKRLNPELRRFCTPPDASPYELRVPAEMKEKFEAADLSITDQERLRFKAYTVRRGDNLSAIAARYGVSPSDVMKLNRISNVRRIRQGTVLILPIPFDAAERKRESRAVVAARTAAVMPPNGRREIQVRVKRGESLYVLAGQYGVSVDDLKRWNRLRRGRVFVGQRLKVYVKEEASRVQTKAAVARADGGPETAAQNDVDRERAAKIIQYRVKRGDTLWGIAKRYSIDIGTILSANDFDSDVKLYPGKRIKIPI